MAVTKTRSDLVTQALANLGVLAAGQTPEAEDYDAVDKHVETTLAGLDADEVVTITDDDQIPYAFFDPIAVVLAQNSALEFGMPGVPPTPEHPNPYEEALQTLRMRTRGKYTGQRQHTEYY